MQNMKTWCCLDKGKSFIKASVGKSVYTLGDRVEACAEIDNSDCSLDIKNLTISLENRLHLSTGWRKKTFKH